MRLFLAFLTSVVISTSAFAQQAPMSHPDLRMAPPMAPPPVTPAYSSDALQKLIRSQTDAIKSLSTKIDGLEKRVDSLEKK